MTRSSRSDTRWDAVDMPAQSGRRVIVTGATSGIGYAAALALAGAGAEIVLAARDPLKAERAIAAIRRVHPRVALAFRPLDTASLASVRAFAAGWRAEDRPIDALILNAGIASVPEREESVDGFERQFATNYLGHFALTGLLLDWLRPHAATRIVSVASLAHRAGRLRFDDLPSVRAYSPQGAYRQSKLAMLMFARELDRRLRETGSPVRAIPVHPGIARTALTRRGDRAGPAARLAGRLILGLIGQPAARGALPLLFAATSPEAAGGTYYGPDGFWEARGHPTVADVAPQARDRAAAERLWTLSETLTGVAYPV